MSNAPRLQRTLSPERTLTLTQLVRSPVVNRQGERLGRVDDVIVRLVDDTGYPPVTGLKVRLGGRDLFVSAQQVEDLQPGRIVLGRQTVDLGAFERRPGEVLLEEDVFDRRLIDVENGRLVHANDLVLGLVDGTWRLLAVDPTPRGLLRRFLPRRLRSGGASPAQLLDWKDVQPFVAHVPTARLLIPPAVLRRLHPAEIADLVEGSSHEEGEEILEAVESDKELEADVFEELDEEHQREFIKDYSNEEAAQLLAAMEPDDAADLLNELDQDRRLPILNQMPAEAQTKLRSLLQYNPHAAGGMMSPDFISVPAGTTMSQALQRVRAAEHTPHQLLGTVFVVDSDSHLVGAVSTVDLVRGNPGAAVETAEGLVDEKVRVEDDLPDVALCMADFNLTAVPVVDGDDRLVGAISVDDVLEAMIPEDWRRRAESDPND